MTRRADLTARNLLTRSSAPAPRYKVDRSTECEPKAYPVESAPMNDSPPKPSLLESLRQRSDAVRNADQATRRPLGDELKEIDRRLLAAFRWLDEALGHLEVIRPLVAHRFAIEPVLTIGTPRYDRGFVSYRRNEYLGMDLVERVELFYRLAGDRPIRVKTQLGAAAAMDERLRAAQLDFDYRVEQDETRGVRCGVFSVTPAVTASARFVPDYKRLTVATTLRNVDRLETVTLEFRPDALGEPALEDLVRLMLGEANTFLKRAPLAGVGAKPVTPGSAALTGMLSLSRYGVAAK